MGTKEDIIMAAQESFFTEGYDKTSIQKIINKLDIAKGTFYHYFKSKSDLMVEIVSIMISQTVTICNEIETSHMTPLEKLNSMYNVSTKYKLENMEKIRAMTLIMHSPHNLILKDKIKTETLKIVSPFINRIIKEGIDTGDFGCKHENLGELINILGMGLGDKIGAILIQSTEDSSIEFRDKIIEETLKDLEMYNYTIETILEIPHNTLKLYDHDIIVEFLKSYFSWD